MTTGPYPYPQIRLTFGTDAEDVLARVDTGCDFPLVIAEALTPRLPAPFGRRRATTVSGQSLRISTFQVVAQLLGQFDQFELYAVAVGDEYLIGLPLLNACRVIFDHGERLSVEP